MQLRQTLADRICKELTGQTASNPRTNLILNCRVARTLATVTIHVVHSHLMKCRNSRPDNIAVRAGTVVGNHRNLKHAAYLLVISIVGQRLRIATITNILSMRLEILLQDKSLSKWSHIVSICSSSPMVYLRLVQLFILFIFSPYIIYMSMV